MNYIEELYYGNIRPNEKGFERGGKYAAALNTVAKKEELLLEALQGGDKEAFVELMDAESDMLDAAVLGAFVEGFRVGGGLVFEMRNEE